MTGNVPCNFQIKIAEIRSLDIRKCMADFDWNQMRGFLVAAETGSFSAAARKLGLTQPTLSRQVAALEQALGLTLFERIGNRLTLTETGLDLLHHGSAITEAADWPAPAYTGPEEAVDG